MINLSILKPTALLFFLSAILTAKSQNITTPRTLSPAAGVSQTIGISTISVNYSRPSVNNRAIWGALVPYGWNVQAFGTGNLAPWRAGANENTEITFSHPVMIEGKSVPAGSYGLFFVINRDNTGEVILSKDSKSWGNFFYDPANDQLRANIILRDIPNTNLLTYEFTNLTKNSCNLVLNWEKKQFPVKIEFAVDEIVMANAEDELKGAIGFNAQSYTSAVNYALQNKVHLQDALSWADKAISINNNFTSQSSKAAVLTALGRSTEADKIMTDALPTANEVQINAYGYQLLTAENTDKAIDIFILNTVKYPKSANAWDSLGEAYFTKNDKKNAIASFKKALSLNPNANVKANSEKFLEQLGAK